MSDGLVQLKNETLWFKFYPDRYKTPYLLTQGKLGISRSTVYRRMQEQGIVKSITVK